MSVKPFEVRFDAFTRRLHWTMRGFWTMADVAGLATAMRAVIAPLGPPPQRYDGLCDSRDFPVQAHDVSEALGAIERAGRAMQNGRVAIVVGSMTNKLQAQRTLTGEGVRVFLDHDTAVAWLDERSTDD